MKIVVSLNYNSLKQCYILQRKTKIFNYNCGLIIQYMRVYL
jgi:hypothetical protein